MKHIAVLEFIVLGLAVHRVARIIGWDSITRGPRERFLGWTDDGKRNRWPKNRKRLAEFIHCPWCQGFWLSVAAWVCFREWHDATILVCVPLAISSAVGVYTTHLDP